MVKLLPTLHQQCDPIQLFRPQPDQDMVVQIIQLSNWIIVKLYTGQFENEWARLVIYLNFLILLKVLVMTKEYI
jgi:hypothetical protein